jgi:anti-sigma regulatory factor (Ser/Thr protein kinase)
VSVLAHPTAALRLSGDRAGCAQAREFTERVLKDWELASCRDDAVTVVSELAANAVLHAGRPDEGEGSGAGVWLKLTRRRAHLVCAVTDQGDTFPGTAHAAGPLEERGRGLFIVEALSQHWGWTRYAPKGKTVWAMLPTGAGA